MFPLPYNSSLSVALTFDSYEQRFNSQTYSLRVLPTVQVIDVVRYCKVTFVITINAWQSSTGGAFTNRTEKVRIAYFNTFKTYSVTWGTETKVIDGVTYGVSNPITITSRIAYFEETRGTYIDAYVEGINDLSDTVHYAYSADGTRDVELTFYYDDSGW